MSTCTAIKEVQELLGRNFSNVDSASLRLRKLLFLGDNGKVDEINAVCKCINNPAEQRRWSSHWPLPTGLETGGKSILLRLEGRLVIHLAGGILENAGMCIHPHFNCPFIPGSGVKGVARHAAWAKWNETKSLEDALKVVWTFGFPTGDKQGLDAYLIKQKPEWFGENGIYKTFAGSVAFLPAFPVEGGFKAVTDIVTCHHPEYYGGKKEKATDDESPNPQFIPAIEAGSLFRFVMRPLMRLTGEDIPSSETTLQWAEESLIEGMTIYGAGAKTAAGYGWFSYDEKAEQERVTQQEAEETRTQRKQMSEDFLHEIEAIQECSSEQFSGLKKRFDELVSCAAEEKVELAGKQQMEDAINRLKKTIPQASPLDQLRMRWETQSPKAIMNGAEIKRFDKQKPEIKKLIVELLREEKGIGCEVWNHLRVGQKGDIAKAVIEIRTYCKNELNLGKMP